MKASLGLLIALAALPAEAQFVSLPGGLLRAGLPPAITAASDNFIRADGNLGANWTQVTSTLFSGGTLLIGSDEVYEQSAAEAIDAYYYWNANTFGANQFSQVILDDVPVQLSDEHWSGVLLRVDAASGNAYIGASTFSPTDTQVWALSSSAEIELDEFTTPITWSAGDVLRAECYDSNPVRIYVYHNGVPSSEFLDWTYNYTGGQPGIGMNYVPNVDSSLHLGNWSGGAIAALPTTLTDNFNRSYATGLLGPLWETAVVGSDQPGQGSMQINGNIARLDANSSQYGGFGFFVARPSLGNHYASITLGSTFGNGGFEGACVRFTLGASTLTGYEAIASNPSGSGISSTRIRGVNGAGGYVELTSSSSVTWSAGDVLTLQASGTNPVALTVLRNGTSVLTWSDSTYNYTGSQVGFTIFQSTGTVPTVSAWSAGNL